MAQNVVEFCFFLLGVLVGGTFNKLLMTGKIDRAVDLINYIVIVAFGITAVWLYIEKHKSAALSKGKLFVLFSLCGWMVGTAWMAKGLK